MAQEIEVSGYYLKLQQKQRNKSNDTGKRRGVYGVGVNAYIPDQEINR